MYLRFPGGNCGLSVCSVRVSQTARERASEHVSKSVSMQRVEQLNSVLNSPALRRGQLSPKTTIFVCSFNFLSFVVDVCPRGCNVARSLRILDLFLKIWTQHFYSSFV